MTKVIFEDYASNQQVIDAPDGQSLMEIAVANGIDVITADCGGASACGTCHVYIDPTHISKLETPTDLESSMLEFIENTNKYSRLSCQITISPQLDGLHVRTPKE